MSYTDNYLQKRYLESESGQHHASEVRKGWGAFIDYGNGHKKRVEFPDDVGDNEHVLASLTSRFLAHERRSGKLPKIEVFSFNRTQVYLERLAVLGTKAVAYGTIGCSLLAGFLDRYRLTLAARIDGLAKAITVLHDATMPCRERLPIALANVERGEALVAKIETAIGTANEITKNFLTVERLPQAAAALTDAETAKKGLEVCVSLANAIVEEITPLEQANEAMTQGNLLTKAATCISNFEMKTARRAWSDYSLGEQSPGFLMSAASAVGTYFATCAAGKAVLTDVLNLSERRASLVANTVGVLAGLYVATYGDGLKISMLAGGIYISAKVIKTVRSCL